MKIVNPMLLKQQKLHKKKNEKEKIKELLEKVHELF